MIDCYRFVYSRVILRARVCICWYMRVCVECCWDKKGENHHFKNMLNIILSSNERITWNLVLSLLSSKTCTVNGSPQLQTVDIPFELLFHVLVLRNDSSNESLKIHAVLYAKISMNTTFLTKKQTKQFTWHAHYSMSFIRLLLVLLFVSCYFRKICGKQEQNMFYSIKKLLFGSIVCVLNVSFCI